jgi:hypothetical protein
LQSLRGTGKKNSSWRKVLERNLNKTSNQIDNISTNLLYNVRPHSWRRAFITRIQKKIGNNLPIPPKNPYRPNKSFTKIAILENEKFHVEKMKLKTLPVTSRIRRQCRLRKTSKHVLKLKQNHNTGIDELACPLCENLIHQWKD